MPKIVINEYDLTKAGTGEYANFSVVVPGYLGENADETVFDENGIYECSSQTDFVNNVGKRAAEIITRSESVKAYSPTIALSIKYNPNQVSSIKVETDTDGKVVAVTYNNKDDYVLAFNALIAGEDAKADFEASLPKTEGSDATPETNLTNAFYLCTAVANTSREIGEFADETYRYLITNTDTATLVEYSRLPKVAEGSTTAEFIPVYDTTATEYFIINDGTYTVTTDGNSEEIPFKGRNGEFVDDRITHYGNQIAYELLGLGYTVLYKKMTEYTITEINALATDVENLKLGENGAPEVDAIGAKQIAANKSAAVNELADPNFWECLRDKSTYDFRYLVTGLLTNNDGANTCILSIADHSQEVLLDDASIQDGRGDCIALIDLDCAAYEQKTQKEAIPSLAKEAAKWGSAYAACFAPYVEYILADDDDYNNNKIFPASFHYLACAANSSANNFSEWYANAGFTRGVSKYTIRTTGCKLGEIAVQSLEPRFILKVDKEYDQEKDEYIDLNTTVAVNLIINVKGSYYLWGNRTGKTLGTRGMDGGDLVAQHFLNIRQLCTTIKKQIYVTCRRLTFDPNSNILWINFRSLLSPMLEQMKADQGIKDFKFVKNDTDRKALLSAKIRIVPIEAVEDFDIGLYLEDSLEDVVITEA